MVVVFFPEDVVECLGGVNDDGVPEAVSDQEVGSASDDPPGYVFFIQELEEGKEGFAVCGLDEVTGVSACTQCSDFA